MDYTLRKLKSDDVFTMATIINKIGYKEFKNCFNNPEVQSLLLKGNGNDAPAADAIGMQIAFDALGIILENLPRTKEEIYSFLAALSGMTKAEIADLDISVFMQMIIDVFKKEEFTDFFQLVSRFLK